jgi:ubiquinone/menaquinone biosynthesis C-methylase UbiE
MKDNFSTQSDEYARFRPNYPDEFFEYLLSITNAMENAWDCATGNGQIAGKLAPYFKQIYATDISQAQIQNAVHLPNINYSIQPAENTDFSDAMFDLIVVAQAIHWFNFNAFYKEVYRTLKKDGHLIVAGYQLLQVSEDIDVIISNFQKNVIGEYWDDERRYIDEGYQTIPFPFKEVTTPEFSISLSWTLEHLMGYLNTWSAVKHFEKRNGYNPVEKIKGELKNSWGNNKHRQVIFPVMLRVGVLKKES